jgi:hypothetical protein
MPRILLVTICDLCLALARASCGGVLDIMFSLPLAGVMGFAFGFGLIAWTLFCVIAQDEKSA